MRMSRRGSRRGMAPPLDRFYRRARQRVMRQGGKRMFERWRSSRESAGRSRWLRELRLGQLAVVALVWALLSLSFGASARVAGPKAPSAAGAADPAELFPKRPAKHAAFRNPDWANQSP